MNKELNIRNIGESTAMIRLTALWALSEAGLGGLLHLFRTPFTGLVVGGVAVVLISLMAYVSERPMQTIPRALLLVLIVKMTISPHSPLPAYLAVAFQGMAGALVFSFIPSFRISCVIVGFLALFESVIQKLITLTLLFGRSLWESLDIFFDFVLEKFAFIEVDAHSEGSYWLIAFYVGLYSITGILIGIFASTLPSKIDYVLERSDELQLDLGSVEIEKIKSKKRSFWGSKRALPIYAISGLIAVTYYFIPQSRIFLDPLWILFRVVLIIVVWYLIVAPFLMKVFRSFLDKKSGQYKEDVNKAISLIPNFKRLVYAVWKSNAHLRRFQKINNVLTQVIAYALIYNNDDEQ